MNGTEAVHYIGRGFGGSFTFGQRRGLYLLIHSVRVGPKPFDQRAQDIFEILQVRRTESEKLFTGNLMVEMDHSIPVAGDLSQKPSLILGENPFICEPGTDFFVFLFKRQQIGCPS